MKHCRIAALLWAATAAIVLPRIAQAQAPHLPPTTAPAPVDPFKDVPASSWVYDAVARAGVPLVPAPGYEAHGAGILRVGKMTRLELAVAVARLLEGLPLERRRDGYRLTPFSPLNSDHVKNLQRLVTEFSPELQVLGIDRTDTVKRLDALRGITTLPFVNVPASSWVYTAIVSLPDSLYGRNPAGGSQTSRVGDMTRYELAVATARIVERMYPPKGAPEQPEAVPPRLSDQDRRTVQRLVNEFAPELRTLKTGNQQSDRYLTELFNRVLPPVAPPFADVPADHWAAASVEKLRLTGIIVGYPAGTFRPQNLQN